MLHGDKAWNGLDFVGRVGSKDGYDRLCQTVKRDEAMVWEFVEV